MTYKLIQWVAIAVGVAGIGLMLFAHFGPYVFDIEKPRELYGIGGAAFAVGLIVGAWAMGKEVDAIAKEIDEEAEDEGDAT